MQSVLLNTSANDLCASAVVCIVMRSASLFDFGLFFFHNARESVARGYGPYFYLPKMESHLEARLWNDAFNLAQGEHKHKQLRLMVLGQSSTATSAGAVAGTPSAPAPA